MITVREKKTEQPENALDQVMQLVLTREAHLEALVLALQTKKSDNPKRTAEDAAFAERRVYAIRIKSFELGFSESDVGEGITRAHPAAPKIEGIGTMIRPGKQALDAGTLVLRTLMFPTDSDWFTKGLLRDAIGKVAPGSERVFDKALAERIPSP